MAALRRGISTLILPEANRGDTEEIPPEVARKLELHFVRSMEEVLPLALVDPIVPRRPARRRSTRLRTALLTT
jgi:ATP-dependent Lon protease